MKLNVPLTFEIRLGRLPGGGSDYLLTLTDAVSHTQVVRAIFPADQVHDLLAGGLVRAPAKLTVHDTVGLRLRDRKVLIQFASNALYERAAFESVFERAEAANPGWCAHREELNYRHVRGDKYEVTLYAFTTDDEDLTRPRLTAGEAS